jgi:CheY-like chemotaxis protein
VLVADDNPAFQNDACELLAGMGATVLLAADGAQAVALARGGMFDLVLMDLQMPVLDGLGATRQIRQHEREDLCARVAVVAYTSNPADAVVMRNCGIDGVLDKPCTEVALRECVARWCDPLGSKSTASYRD